MEIYKIPACWPSSFIYGISVAEMLMKENLIDKKYSANFINSTNIDNTLMDFIFQFSNVANLSRETSQASIFIFEHFVNSYDLAKYDIQLIAMACILVCSKMFDVKPLSMSTLHRISAHVYNNSMVLDAENIVLKMVNYDLFVRDKLIVDRVGLYLESIRFLISPKDFDKFSDLCFRITDLIYEDTKIIKETDFNLLCAGIIHASLVIAIKRDGKLPMTIKCINNYLDLFIVSMISGVKEDDIMKFAKKIIKHTLGKNIYKKFTF